MEEDVDYKLAYEKRGEVLKDIENEIYRLKEDVMEEVVDYKLAYEKRGEVLKNMENEIYRLAGKISSLYKIIEVLKKNG